MMNQILSLLETSFQQFSYSQDENARLQTLYETQLLPLQPNYQQFDMYTRLLARHYQTMMSLLVVFDAQTIHILSSTANSLLSFPISSQYPRQLPSIPLQHPLETLSPSVILPILPSNQLIQSYVSYPIMCQGYILGMICLFDTKPRHDFLLKEFVVVSDIAKILEDLFNERRQQQVILSQDRQVYQQNLQCLLTQPLSLAMIRLQEINSLKTRFYETFTSVPGNETFLLNQLMDFSILQELIQSIVCFEQEIIALSAQLEMILHMIYLYSKIPIVNCSTSSSSSLSKETILLFVQQSISQNKKQSSSSLFLSPKNLKNKQNSSNNRNNIHDLYSFLPKPYVFLTFTSLNQIIFYLFDHLQSYYTTIFCPQHKDQHWLHYLHWYLPENISLTLQNEEHYTLDLNILCLLIHILLKPSSYYPNNLHGNQCHYIIRCEIHEIPTISSSITSVKENNIFKHQLIVDLIPIISSLSSSFVFSHQNMSQYIHSFTVQHINTTINTFIPLSLPLDSRYFLFQQILSQVSGSFYFYSASPSTTSTSSAKKDMYRLIVPCICQSSQLPLSSQQNNPKISSETRKLSSMFSTRFPSKISSDKSSTKTYSCSYSCSESNRMSSNYNATSWFNSLSRSTWLCSSSDRLCCRPFKTQIISSDHSSSSASIIPITSSISSLSTILQTISSFLFLLQSTSQSICRSLFMSSSYPVCPYPNNNNNNITTIQIS